LVEQLVVGSHFEEAQVGVVAFLALFEFGERFVLVVVFGLALAIAVEVEVIDGGVAPPVDFVV